jgi:hypothetical protein
LLALGFLPLRALHHAEKQAEKRKGMGIEGLALKRFTVFTLHSRATTPTTTLTNQTHCVVVVTVVVVDIAIVEIDVPSVGRITNASPHTCDFATHPWG